MVGKAPEGGLSTSSLISLLPRQVMLESCSAAASAEKKAKKARKGGRKEKRCLSKERAALLHAIAVYLESSGFTRTLAMLRSEAGLQIDDGSKAPDLDLEGILCKYLQSSCSEDPIVENISVPEAQDAHDRAANKEEEGICDHSEEPISKKKKRKGRGGNDSIETKSDTPACENGAALPNQLVVELHRRKLPDVDHVPGEKWPPECHMKSKDQKRKKSKKVSDETAESFVKENLETLDEGRSNELVSLPENTSSLLDESNIRSKDMKKKKKKNDKLASDLLYGIANQVGLETSWEEKGKSGEFGSKSDSQVPTFATENATSVNLMREDGSKTKDKKNQRHKLVVESSSGCPELQNGSTSDSQKNEKSISLGIEDDAKESHQNVENVSSSSNAGNVNKKAKKTKKSASEQTKLHVDEKCLLQESKQRKPVGLTQQKDKEETEKIDDSSLDGELHNPGKKRKREKSQEDSEKSANMPVKEKSKIPNDANETPIGGSSQNEIKGQQQINGDLQKNEQEGNGLLESNKEELKRSAVTVNAFKRVKVDEVKFADERLQDNSYWAKDGAETGYGAKAQEILAQVKGRDFRHEKTKKKRGSYRGGQIDFQSHSVKFKYSDDEE